MRVGTARLEGRTAAVAVDGDRAIELGTSDVGEWLRAGRPGPTVGAAEHHAAALEFAPLIRRPGKVVCVGHNYLSHMREVGVEPPLVPTLFAKFSETLIGATDPIVYPLESVKVDWEAELAIVVGRRLRRADRADAATAIAGFTVSNDISARDFQRRTGQWLAGKVFDRSTPLGPVMVTADDVGVTPDLAVTCHVDGVEKQSGRTSDMHFSAPEILAYISQLVTLAPGDVVLTGTPGGIGDTRQPAEYLRPGSVVTTSIEHIGQLRNVVVAAEQLDNHPEDEDA